MYLNDLEETFTTHFSKCKYNKYMHRYIPQRFGGDTKRLYYTLQPPSSAVPLPQISRYRESHLLLPTSQRFAALKIGPARLRIAVDTKFSKISALENLLNKSPEKVLFCVFFCFEKLTCSRTSRAGTGH